MIRRPAALLALLTLLVAAPVALAHEGNPNYRSVVKSVTPNTTGLNVEILNFDDRVLLHNTSDEDVEIFGYENDEPYAQVKADGTVLVNTNSKAYYLNEDRQGDAAVPQDLPSEPAWKELSKSGRFEWHDHRMHWMGEGDPPQLTDKSKETVIYDNWQIPIAVGGTKGEVSGTLTWVPLDSGGLPLGAIFGFAALIIVLSIAVFIVRRRRGGEPSEEQPRRPSRRGEAGRRAPPRARRGARGAGFGARPRDAAVDGPGARRPSSTPRRRRSSSSSTRRSRRASAPCACSTRPATRSRSASPTTPRTARSGSRSSSRTASATAPTRPPTASCPPTATRSRAATSSPSARAPRRRASLDQLLASEGDAGPVTNTALSVARAVQYAAIAIGLGGLIFFLFCWRPAGLVSRPFTARLERILLFAAIAGFVSAFIAVILQGAIGQGAIVLVRRAAGHVRRGPRHPLRPRLGHRRRRLARRARRAGHAPAARARWLRLPRRSPTDPR